MKVAILIALEVYADERLKPAQFAEADVRTLAATLEPLGFCAANQVLLINGDATKGALESRVKRTIKGLDAGDEFILCYTGRGFSKHEANFLTCHDTSPDALADTSLPLNWLLQQFKDTDCRQIACFLDARESGKPKIENADDITSGVTEAELRTFFESHAHCVCFAASRTNEASYISKGLKHGIWLHHVIEAFAGRAPTALASGVILTAELLQNYLEREVPRTLTKTFTTKKVQTPWMAGGGRGEFRLADLTQLLAKRGSAADEQLGQVKHVSLLVQRTQAVRSMSGFKKGHKEPDRVSSNSEAFITTISSEEITSDVNRVFGELKTAFRFKRADLHMSNLGDGTATIITPYFNYSITVEQDRADPSQVIFWKKVDAIKEPGQIFSDEFAAVFANVFDTVEFETPVSLDLPTLIDRIEELNDVRISIAYNPEVSYCSLHIAGVAGAITVTSRSLAIVHVRPAAPRNLLQSLFGIQKALVDEHDIRLFPG